MLKLVVIGKSGQLVWEIVWFVLDVVCLGCDDIDIIIVESIVDKFDMLVFDVVINVFVYMVVDKVESDEVNVYLLN